jgi:hypothetical protein
MNHIHGENHIKKTVVAGDGFNIGYEKRHLLLQSVIHQVEQGESLFHGGNIKGEKVESCPCKRKREIAFARTSLQNIACKRTGLFNNQRPFLSMLYPNFR